MITQPPLDDIAAALVEIAETDPTISAVARKPDGGWLVARGEDDRVEIDIDPADGRLVLMQWAGRPRAADREGALAALLTFSSMWRDTGHVRAALTEPGGDALLICDLPPQALTRPALEAVIAGLAAKGAIVRELIETAPPVAGDAASDIMFRI